jgi:hypothetical protein
MLKEKVCKNNLHPLEELQENIRHELSNIPVQQPCWVSKNILMI